MDQTYIGSGKTATVYKVQNEAHKVFPPSYPHSWIEKDSTTQNYIKKETHLPVLECYVSAENHSIAMPFIDGITLGQRMRTQKYKEGLSDLIDLQTTIHSTTSLDLENAHDTFLTELEALPISESLKDKGKNILNAIPRMTNLCHFDFHYNNILFADSEYIIIDWVNAKLSNPVLDIARTYLILKQYVTRQSEKYLKLISEKEGIEIKAIRDAIPLMALFRLQEIDASEFKDTLWAFINN